MNELPPERAEYEAILIDFDRQWNLAGEASIGEYLSHLQPKENSSGARLALLVELIKIDLEYSWRLGRERKTESYVAEFPELKGNKRILIELASEEIALRIRLGRPVVNAELVTRFGSIADRLTKLANETRRVTDSKPNADDKSISAQPSLQFDPGYLVGERYELHDQVGEGSLSVVYRAWDLQLLRWVAVKIARFTWDPALETGMRFQREGLAAARLSHPGIVSVFDVGQMARNAFQDSDLRVPQRAFIVQELMTNGSLASRIDGKTLSAQEAAGWLMPVLEAVDYAHQCGVIHRDLKPANILIDQQGLPRVADFGLAIIDEASQRSTREGDVLGTPAYMSPEQARGDTQQVAKSSDIYSLGVILFQMLTGKLPWSGPTSSVMKQVIDGRFSPPRKCLQSISREAETICLKAMSHEPKDRYATCRAFADDLARFLRHEPITARSPGPIRRIHLWVRRRPTEAITAIAATAVIAILATVSFAQIARERNRLREQRDLTQASLYDALVNDVENQLRVKGTNWHSDSLQSIRAAIALDLPSANHRRLRDLACELLIDSSSRLEPIGELNAIRSQEHDVPDTQPKAISAEAIEFVKDTGCWLIGYSDGSIHYREMSPDRLVSKLIGADAAISSLRYSALNQSVWSVSNEKLWRFKLPLVRDENKIGISLSTHGRVQHESVSAIAISADGSKLAIGTVDGQLAMRKLNEAGVLESDSIDPQKWIWFTDSKSQRSTGPSQAAHRNSICSIAFSADGQQIASAGLDRQVRLWDVSTLRLERVWGVNDPARNLLFLGNELIFSTNESYALYRLSLTGTLTSLESLTSPVSMAAVLSNGTLVSTTLDGRLTLWHDNHIALEASRLEEIRTLAIQTNPEILATGHSNGNVRFWKVVSSDILRKRKTAHAMDLLPDNSVVDAEGRESFDNATNQWGRRTPFRRKRSTALASGQTRLLVACANDENEILVLARDEQCRKSESDQASDGEDLFRVRIQSPAVAVAFGDDDRLLSWLDTEGVFHQVDWQEQSDWQQIAIDEPPQVLDGKITFESTTKSWFVSDGTRIYQFAIDGTTDNPIRRLSFSGSHQVLDVKNGRVLLPSNATGIEIRDAQTFEVVGRVQQESPVRMARFSPSGQIVYSVSDNLKLVGWDWQSGTMIGQTTIPEVATNLHVDPLNQYLILNYGWQMGHVVLLPELLPVATISLLAANTSWSHDGNSLWHSHFGLSELQREKIPNAVSNAPDSGTPEFVYAGLGQVLLAGHNETVWSVDCSPDGSLTATCSHDQTVKLWNNNNGNLETNWCDHDSAVWRVAFSPDGKLLAAGTQSIDPNCGEVVLYDVATHALVGRYTISSRLVAGIDWHPNLPWLAVGTFDGTAAILDWRTGETVHKLGNFKRAIMDVHFRSDGRQLAAACPGEGFLLWSIPESASEPISSPRSIRRPGLSVWCVRFSGNGELLATGDQQGNVSLYRTDDLMELLRIPTGCVRLRYLRIGSNGDSIHGSSFAGQGFSLAFGNLSRQLHELGLGIR